MSKGYIVAWKNKDNTAEMGDVLYKDQTAAYSKYVRLFIRHRNGDGTTKVHPETLKPIVSIKKIEEVHRIGFID